MGINGRKVNGLRGNCEPVQAREDLGVREGGWTEGSAAGSMMLGARKYGNEDGLEGVFRCMMVRERLRQRRENKEK